MDATPHITPRQRDAMLLVAQGLSYDEVAARLCVTRNTVSNHLQSVYREYGFRNQTEVALWCAYVGLLDLDVFGAQLSEQMRARREYEDLE